MEVTAAMVKELRERTQAGMMDCKKALVASDGNMDKAVEYLREKGLAAVAKKAGRVASEGMVDSYIHMGGKIGVLVEVNCETDFVAKTDKFKELCHDVALQIAELGLGPKIPEIDRYIREQMEQLQTAADKAENLRNDWTGLEKFFRRAVLPDSLMSAASVNAG